MIKNSAITSRRSAVLMAFAASARDVNGEPATAPDRAPTFGAATGGLEPAPPSMPGDAGIDSVTGPGPVLKDLSRSILSSPVTPPGPYRRNNGVNSLGIEDYSQPWHGRPRRRSSTPGIGRAHWAERFAVRPRGSS